MLILSILTGCLLLIAGRQFFWAFIGIVGFLFGFQIGELYLIGYPGWLQLGLAFVFGVTGIIVSILFYRAALIIAGILTGGILALNTSVLLFQHPIGGDHQLIFLIGAVLGGVLAVLLLDWAIIALSSLTGAMLIVQPLFLGAGTTFGLVLGLTLIGVLVQGGQLKNINPP